MSLDDRFGRPLRSLRISVTDRCNLRCRYCMPEKEYRWLERSRLLTFEEIELLAGQFVSLGVDRIRLTGGEPLLRRNLPSLVERLAALPIHEIALTTNGTLLAQNQRALFAAGLSRVTVSLDALEPKLFENLTQRRDLSRVLEGLESVAGRPGLKIDTVLIKDVNESQIVPLLEYAQRLGAELRFIEYMDVGGATRWSRSDVLSQAELLEHIASHLGAPRPVAGRGSAPARRFELPTGQKFGVIASVTEPFCRSCDRVRLTADGQLLTCLYSRQGLDLRTPLRSALPPEEIQRLLASVWRVRSDRGAEERAALQLRGPLADTQELQENLHLEMHTRGG